MPQITRRLAARMQGSSIPAPAHIGRRKWKSAQLRPHRSSAVELVHLLPLPVSLSWENFNDLRNALNSSWRFCTSSRSPLILKNQTWLPDFTIAANVAFWACDSSCFAALGTMGTYSKDLP